MTSRRCLGAVLAGGDARRWGGAPKGLAVVDGLTILERVRLAITPVCDGPPVLVVRHWLTWLDEVPDTWTLVFDRLEGSGPLGGIDAALGYAEMHGYDGALVVAWDMPWVTPDLLAAIRRECAGDVSAVIPARDGDLDPLCAWYSVHVRDTVASSLAKGERSVRKCVERFPNVCRLTQRELSAWGDPERLLANINAPSELPRD